MRLVEFFEVCFMSLLAMFVVFLSFAFVLGVDVLVQEETLRHCPAEDSENCIWNAQTMGNLSGRSFIRWEGVTYYADNASD